jgi:hypothetical protein
VFQLNNDNLINTPSEVRSAKSEFSKKAIDTTPKLKENANSQLDWELISDRINQLFKIDPKDLLKNQDLIMNLHAFYGLDEIAIIDLIGRTSDIVTNTIDPVRLKKSVQDRYEKNANITVKQTEVPNDQQMVSNNNFNKSESLLLEQAKKLVPADFLAAEKRKTNGFIGAVESRALRDIAMKTYLSPAVLNIMVDYILQNFTNFDVATDGDDGKRLATK